MPLRQRDQYSDKKGMGLVRLGGVICLFAFLFGSVCMAIVATMGDGEDPPEIFEQMGGASCAIFALGFVISLVGWLILLNQPEAPKPTLNDLRPGLASDHQSDDEPPEGAKQGDTINKPDPYASDHRRRDI